MTTDYVSIAVAVTHTSSLLLVLKRIPDLKTDIYMVLFETEPAFCLSVSEAMSAAPIFILALCDMIWGAVQSTNKSTSIFLIVVKLVVKAA